jgi:NADH-quinone oxidoreductase subunit C
MSKQVLSLLQERFGAKILAVDSFRGDDEALVAPEAWHEVALFLRDDAACTMDHFIDLTAVDYPEREPEQPRFDVLVSMRSQRKNHRLRLKVQVRDGELLDSLTSVWAGANWTEREVYDLFGVHFKGHPDLRRILLYEEFVGHPLRKDYPISKTQPLVEYRDVGPAKLAPFGSDEGQPFGRIDWLARMQGRNQQVSPAIAVQHGQQPALSIRREDTGPDAPQGQPVRPDQPGKPDQLGSKA